jgi:hypothetical protein
LETASVAFANLHIARQKLWKTISGFAMDNQDEPIYAAA